MHSRTLFAVVVASLLYLSSCRTVPPKPEATRKPTKHSVEVARYMKSMEDRLGPIWYKLTEVHEDELHLGTVETTFEIPAAGGTVRNIKVMSNTGGRMDELIARRAIAQLRAPPVPAAILSLLHEDHLVAEESFTVFANP